MSIFSRSGAYLRFLSIKIFINSKQYNSKAGVRYLTEKRKISPVGWFLLLIPTTTFGLGTWQVQRKKWKENLITELQTRTNTDPVPLPKSFDEIQLLEYYPVHVRGEFLHDNEIYLGPRSLIKGEAVGGGLFSTGQSTSNGYLIVTPFKLDDRDQTILVNRGWVSHKNKYPNTRPAGQVKGKVDLVGIVRCNEIRQPFMTHNKPESNMWFYRDLNQMCAMTGAEPVFLDATNDFAVEGGPIGGQTRVALRNEHWSYILTWYSLSAASGLMWYAKFIKGIHL